MNFSDGQRFYCHNCLKDQPTVIFPDPTQIKVERSPVDSRRVDITVRGRRHCEVCLSTRLGIHIEITIEVGDTPQSGEAGIGGNFSAQNKGGQRG